VLIDVKFDELVRAFSHLPLPVKHEAAAEYVDLIVVSASRVTLSALDIFVRRIRDLLEND